MSKLQANYTLKAKLWIYPGMAAWHFVSIPKKESAKISETFHDLKRGWGSLPVLVTLGSTTWKTSIFPDKKSGSYLLPIKASVRKSEKATAGQTISFAIHIIID